MWMLVHDDHATVGDLAAAAADYDADVLDVDAQLLINGDAVASHQLLTGSGLIAGCRLGAADNAADHAAPQAASTGVVIMLAVVAGPEAGARFVLGHGRHLVGGAPGISVNVTGGQVAPHALIMDVEVHELTGVTVSLTHMAGPVPTCQGVDVTDRMVWPAEVPLQLGCAHIRWSMKSVEPGSTPGRSLDPHDPWRMVVERRGRVMGPDAGAKHTDHDAGATAGWTRPPLVPAVIGAVTALTMAAVIRQPMLAWFALSSAAATALWWLIGSLRERRRRVRQHEARGQAQVFDADRVRRYRSELHGVAPMIRGEIAGLWERRPQRHDDMWQLTVGRGSEHVGSDVWWHDVPVAVDVGPGTRLGVGGAGAMALVRALLAHLVTQVGPADVRLTVIAALDDRRLGDIAVLPHARSSAGHEVVIVVDPSPTVSPGRFANTAAALVVVDGRDHDDSLDAWCSTVIRWDGVSTSTVVMMNGSVSAMVAPAGASAGWWHDMVRTLVALRDPEAMTPPAPQALNTVASGVPWYALHPGWRDVDDTIRRWRTTTGGVVARIGRSVDGIVEVDLTRHGPHALIAGTTGAGKSELLRTLVAGWAWSMAPDRLQFVLIDYKGGAAFDACWGLPHVVGVVTDLDGDLVARVLTGLRAELTRRERLLRHAGVSDVERWDGREGSDPTWQPLARLVIVVDEFAALVSELPDLMTSLVAVAQRGRSLGVHMVLATQRPAGVVRDDIRANTELRICLRVADRGDAMDVVGDDRPASFDRSRPGQALLRRGAVEPIEVQVANTSAPWTADPTRLELVPAHRTPRKPQTPPAHQENSTLRTVVDTLAAAASTDERWRSPTPLWMAPLPAVLPAPEVPGEVVGLLDDPTHQRRVPLRCQTHGHTVVIGGPRSGVTCTLDRIAALHREYGHQIIVLNAESDPGDGPKVLERLITQLNRREPTTVIMDGVGMWRRRWEHDHGATGWQLMAMWERLLAEGPASGIVVVAGADRVASCGATLIAVATTRWMLRPLDPLDPLHLGVRWPYGADAVVPPGRLVDAATGLTGQMYAPQ